MLRDANFYIGKKKYTAAELLEHSTQSEMYNGY